MDLRRPLLRDAIPKPRDLANAEFSTLRLRLMKIAARVIETASRVVSLSPPHARRPTSSAACPEPSPRSDPERRGRSPSAPISLQRVRKSIGRQAVKKPNEPVRPEVPKAA